MLAILPGLDVEKAGGWVKILAAPKVVSDDEPHFRKVGARFLGEKIQDVEVVPLPGVGTLTVELAGDRPWNRVQRGETAQHVVQLLD